MKKILSIIFVFSSFVNQSLALEVSEELNTSFTDRSRCADLEGPKQMPGKVCKTSTGALFVRISAPKLGWLLLGGRDTIWFDATKYGVDQGGAASYCKRKDQALPSFEDFDSLRIALGMHEKGHITAEGRKDLYSLFPDVISYWFWTSSPASDKTSFWIFEPTTGYIRSTFNYTSINSAALCVSL